MSSRISIKGLIRTLCGGRSMPARPNFLIFVTDQMQSLSLGCNGNPDVKTPNIDLVAAAGLSFTRAYCNNPVCMPSRATMITGLTPRQHGCLTNGCVLPQGVPTITQALTHAGYRTHAVGKLHLQPFMGPDVPADGPPVPSWESRALWGSGRITELPLPYYGFQTADFVGGHVDYCFGDYANWLTQHHPGVHDLYGRDSGYSVVESVQSCWRMEVPPELHYNHWVADRTMDFLQSVSPGESFFLWCSFPDPHFPFAACRPYSEMHDPSSVGLSPTHENESDPCSRLAARRQSRHDFDELALREIVAQTYGMISHVDENVGRVLECLAVSGAAENTVVVFMSDHGEYLGAHHLLYKSEWPWEELLRIPFIWQVPGSEAGRSASSEVVSLLDFAPTVLDYAGVDPEVLDMRGEGRADRDVLPGRSLRPLLDEGRDLAPRSALIEYDEDWHPGPVCRMRTLVEDRYKLTVYPHAGEGILTDLVNDPSETVNLWDDAAHATTRSRMVETLLSQLVVTDRMDTLRISGA